jgi:hypothetical protein
MGPALQVSGIIAAAVALINKAGVMLRPAILQEVQAKEPAGARLERHLLATCAG